ncbi:MAG: DNA repair protein RecO [candidate division FCPU426 bacterium]
MSLLRTSAIILRHYPFSEADRVLVLLTDREGKCRALAKGVRRSQSRLAASVGLFSLSELQLHGREHQDLMLVTQGQLVTAYPRLKSDLQALASAARWSELVDRLLPDRQPLPEIFSLLKEALALLETGLAPLVAGLWFENRLLDLLGYRPHLAGCVCCQRSEGPMKYAPDRGGAVCLVCEPAAELPLSPGARAMLEKIRQLPADKVRRLDVLPRVGEEAAAALEAALLYQLGRTLHSDKFRRAVAGLKG